MENQWYLISGIFFQPRVVLTTMWDKTLGARAALKEGISGEFYFGCIGSSAEDSPNELEGVLTDKYGKSELRDVAITDKEFSFVKKYDSRKDLINYKFTKTGILWEGTYEGTAVGHGISRCTLAPISQEFFLLEEEKAKKLMKQLL